MTYSGVNLRLFDSRAHNLKQYQPQLEQCQENIKCSVNTNSANTNTNIHLANIDGVPCIGKILWIVL